MAFVLSIALFVYFWVVGYAIVSVFHPHVIRSAMR